MAYKIFRMGGDGTNLSAAEDFLEGVTILNGCQFEEDGALTSFRGRAKINNSTQLGGATGTVRGGYDGLAGTAGSLLKFRFFKKDTSVYTNTDLTALTDSNNRTVTYTTSVGTLVNAVKGLTAPTWHASNPLSGFTYGGYAYSADGGAIQRHKITSVSALAVTNEAWGLVAPGYHEISTDGTLSCNNTTTVTFTHPTAHGYGFGVASSPSYPYTMNVEFVGFKTLKSSGVDVIPDNEINCLHYAGSGATADIDVTSASANLNTSGATEFTITYQNGAGAFDWQKVNVQAPSGGATPLNSTLESTTVTHGSPDPSTDEVQKIYWQSGTAATQGYFRLKFSRGGGDYQITENIPYNATVQQVEDAILALSFFNTTLASTSAVSVTGAATMTFTVATTPTGGALTGGGTAGFIRQGPTLTEGTSGGDLVGGTYYYAYTFYNGVAESNFSARVPIAVSTGSKVTLTNVLMGPVGTTARRIYRTDVDGRQLYFVGQIDNNTDTSFTDTARLAHGASYFAQPGDAVSDAESPAGETDEQARGRRAGKRGVREATASAKAKDEKLREKLATNLGLLSDWTDHDAPPSDLKEVGLIGDTVFGISGSALCFSRSGEPEHWPLANRVTPGRNTSETLQQWMGFDGQCIMYTDNGLYRLSPISLDFSEVRFEEIESPVGLAGPRAVAALDGTQGHVFLARNGIYLFDGVRVIDVSRKLYKFFNRYTGNPFDNFRPEHMGQAVMVTSGSKVFLSLRTTAGAGSNDLLLLGDFKEPTNPKWSVMRQWSFGSLWRERSSNYVLAGDYSGYAWVIDTDDYTSDGGSIAWGVWTPYYRLTPAAAIFDEVEVYGEFAGATTTIYVYLGMKDTYKEATFTTSTTGGQRHRFKLPQHFRGENIQVNVSSTYAGRRKLYWVGFTYRAVEQEP